MKFMFPLYFPDDTVEAAPETEDLSDLDILDDKGDDDAKEDEETEDTETDEGNDRESDDGQKGKESKSESDEDTLIRVSYSDVKKEFPEFFKRFPQLKTAFFREQEFTKRFANLDDADEAIEAIESFRAVEETVKAGNAGEFLDQVATISDRAVDRFANNFLPALFEKNQKAYFRVTAPLIRNVLAEVLEAGQENDNQNLQNAAKVVHQAIFRDDKYGKVPMGQRPQQADPELTAERHEFYSGKHNELMVGVTKDIRSQLESEIAKSIDPTKSMRPGIKKLIMEKIVAEVDKEVSSDPNHMNRIMSLWRRERQSKYSGRYKGSIVTAYLSRARTSMPSVRKAVRSEILGQQKDEDESRSSKVNRNTNVPTGSASRGSSRTISVSDARSKKLSDKDIIARS
jgi:hypothetical protein